MHFNYKGLLFVLLTLVWGGITTSCHSELEDSLSDNEHRVEAEPTFREGDSITITHDAHSRRGFALGAVLAAEYTAKHTGLLSTDDLFDF